MRRVLDAQGSIADRAQDTLVKAERRAHHVFVDARAGPLFHERNAHAARQEEIDSIRIRGTDLRDLGGIIGLAQLGVNLVHDLALEGAFKASHAVDARRIVGRHQEHFPDPVVIGPQPTCLVKGVVLPCDVEIHRAAPLARQCRRTGVGRQVEFALGCHAGHHGHGQVGPYDTGHDIDLLGLDHLVGQLHCDVGLLLVVFDNDIQHVVALGRQHKAVAHINAQARTAA